MLHSVGSPVMWIGFLVFIFAMLALDLGVFNRTPHTISFRSAIGWTLVWITMSLCFAGVVYHLYGAQSATQYLTGFLLEKALSVDNIFVFILIFTGFGVAGAQQHRVLFWGILGAVVLRGIFIVLGAAVVSKYHWMLAIFGAILLYTGVKVLLGGDEEEKNVEDNPIVKFCRRFLPVTDGYRGSHFMVRENGRLMFTPLFIVLITIELSDLIFAVDSIPAVLAVTQDPFIVFTSNIFAILGLRSIYFVLASLVPMFRFLKYGVGVILLFIAAKILLDTLLHIEMPEWTSLAVVLGAIVVSMSLSRLIPEKKGAEPDAELQPPAGEAVAESSET